MSIKDVERKIIPRDEKVHIASVMGSRAIEELATDEHRAAKAGLLARISRHNREKDPVRAEIYDAMLKLGADHGLSEGALRSRFGIQANIGRFTFAIDQNCFEQSNASDAFGSVVTDGLSEDAKSKLDWLLPRATNRFGMFSRYKVLIDLKDGDCIYSPSLGYDFGFAHLNELVPKFEGTEDQIEIFYNLAMVVEMLELPQKVSAATEAQLNQIRTVGQLRKLFPEAEALFTNKFKDTLESLHSKGQAVLCIATDPDLAGLRDMLKPAEQLAA